MTASWDQRKLTDLELRLVECASPNTVTEDELDGIKDSDKGEIRTEVLVALCAGERPE